MYKIIDDSPIIVSGVSVSVNDILAAIESTNQKLKNISDATRAMSLNIFEILDLRTLSGAIGETFVGEMSSQVSYLRKNPSLDGYPDLVLYASPEMKAYYDNYARQDSKEDYLYGGIEVKDTFGYKAGKVDLLPGEQRVTMIQKRLQWKAHHQKTNHLLGLYSDYIDDYPKIVAAFYSDQLTEADWSKRAEPKPGSEMTSFSTLQASGYSKMRAGMKICLDEPMYLDFFDVEA